MLYEGYVVINNKELELALESPWTEEEAQTAMDTFAKAKSLWLGLADGSMVSINSSVMSQAYFIAKPIVE